MKALVIGGSGFIGSHIVDRLVTEGWEVTVFDRERSPYRSAPLSVQFEEGEFDDTDRIGEVVSRDFDVVVHSLSTTTPKTSNDDIEYDICSNLVATVKLIEACTRKKRPKLVFISSGGAIYGNNETGSSFETDELQPICSYAITKLAVEKYLHMFHSLFGLNYVSLRVSNPYGPRQNPYGGHGAVATFLARIIADEPIDIWGDGRTVRDYLHVSDVADACYRAATSTCTGVYNVGSGTGTTLLELIALLGATVGKKPVVRHLPERRLDVRRIVLDCTKAERELGWKARIPLTVGVRETAKWVATVAQSIEA